MSSALPRMTLAGLVAVALAATAATARPLRYAEDRAPAAVNPLFATTMADARLHELLYDGLYADDLDLRSAPRLAASDVVAADGRSMTIRLRDDVAWHDGTPFTAADVVFTVQAMRDPKTASPEAARVAWIEQVEAPDAHTVSLRFREVVAQPQDRLHFKILPAHLFTGTAVERSDPFRTRPIGTGPFRLATFNADASVSLQRSPSPWRPNSLEEVQMREVADKTFQARLLQYGSLEALIRVLPRDLATLQADRSVELYPYQTNTWWYLGFRLGDPRLADPRVREALTLLIDRSALLAPIGTGDLLSGPFVKSSPFYNHDVPERAPDPERAATLLTQAGWTRDGDVWKIGGQPVVLRVAALARQETVQEVVINLQSQLRAHGIGLRQDFLLQPEWKARVWGARDFDLVLSQWSFDRNEDVREQFATGGERNVTGFSDAVVDALLDEARSTPDPQRKRELLKAVHARVAELNPMMFLWTLDAYAAISADVQHVHVHPFYFFTWATGWQLP